MANTTLPPLGETRYAGLDVSACAGDIDFAKVRESGREAVYIRASVASDYADPNLDANYIAARENGLLVGFYHVLTARSPEQARQQASFFAGTVGNREMQMRPAMDFDYLAGLTPSAANAIALAFLEAVESEMGQGAAIYTDAARAQNLWSAEIAARYPLWLAGCGAPANGKWQGWSGWQYAVGSPEGVSGRAGLDRFTDGILVPAQANEGDAQAAVPTLASAADLAAAAQTYTIQRGDTLSEIAERFGTTVDELVRLNNIADRDRIYEGDRLIIRAGTPSGSTTYTVQRGDTLSEIAERFGTTVSELVRLNNIQNPNLIYPGQVLIIRQGGSTTPPSGSTTYTVQRGDTLSEIANRFGTTVNELVRLNNIQNPNLIYPGQVLVIREGGSTTPPSGTTTYTVQRGDTLSEIAERFGTTVNELVRLNNIADRDLIYPGQVLVIREGGSTTPPSGTITYTVQRNDNLTSIANRFGTTVNELVRLNNIQNPNLIYPGQVLIIREGGSTTPPSGTTTYTVQRGDTLSEIAERFGTTVNELVRLNSIQNPNLIYPGQVLILPEGGCVDTYIVQRGDTLSEIAERFGTTVARLAGINGIRNTNRIYVGQILDLGLC